MLVLQANSQRAVRELAEQVAYERASFRRLAAEVKNRLRALPDVATVAAGAVQVRHADVKNRAGLGQGSTKKANPIPHYHFRDPDRGSGIC